MKKVLEIGKTYTVGNRVRKVIACGLNEDYFNGNCEVVLYTVKDGSERYESKQEFDKWLQKAN